MSSSTRFMIRTFAKHAEQKYAPRFQKKPIMPSEQSQFMHRDEPQPTMIAAPRPRFVPQPRLAPHEDPDNLGPATINGVATAFVAGGLMAPMQYNPGNSQAVPDVNPDNENTPIGQANGVTNSYIGDSLGAENKSRQWQQLNGFTHFAEQQRKATHGVASTIQAAPKNGNVPSSPFSMRPTPLATR